MRSAPTRRRRAELHQAENESSYRSANGLSFDDLIDPRDLRNVVIESLAVSAQRRSGVPRRSPVPASRPSGVAIAATIWGERPIDQLIAWMQ